MALVGPGLGSGISSDSGGKTGLSQIGKDMLDYNFSYHKESKVLFGAKTATTIIIIMGIILFLII